MNARSLELFKALTEATFWFYTHPKDTSYRLIYNKSRYTMDKPRILKMLRLYVPFIRRLDDTALITYMYRNGGVVVAQMQSGQLANLQSVSDELPNTLQAVTEADLAAQQKAIDEAIAKEQEAQRVKSEKESKKKDKEANPDRIGAGPANGASGQKNTKKEEAPAKPVPTPVEPVFNDEYAAMAENLGMRAGTGNVEVTAITPPIITPVVGTGVRAAATQNKSLAWPTNIGTSTPTSPSIGPGRWEKMLGGVMTASSGAPIVNAGRNITSQAGIFVRRQGVDRVGKAFSGWINRGSGQSVQNQYGYSVDEEFDEYTTYSRSGSDGEKKKGWALLGMGLGWWIVILLILIMLFSVLGGNEEESSDSGSSDNPVETVGGGVGGGICPTLEAIKANRQSPESCRYFGLGVDLFNTNISNTTIETYVSKYSPVFIKAGKGDVAEFRKRVDYIVQSSKTAGLNPVLFLGYWKTESWFSTVGSRDLGCVGDDFYEQVDCALGIRAFADPTKNPIANCARSKDAESIACKTLKGIRSKPFLDPQNPISYPIKTFDDFAEAHGSRAPELDGGAVNNNCVSTYNSLVEEAIAAGECKISTGGGNSCQGGWPVTGKITQGPIGGSHSVYQGTGIVAVDIDAATGTPVYATFSGTVTGVSYVDTGWEDGRGIFVEIQAPIESLGGRVATIRYLHFSQTAENIKIGQKIAAGTLLGYVGATGRADGSHLHMDFKNIEMVPPFVPVAIKPPECTSNCSVGQIKACK